MIHKPLSSPLLSKKRISLVALLFIFGTLLGIYLGRTWYLPYQTSNQGPLKQLEEAQQEIASLRNKLSSYSKTPESSPSSAIMNHLSDNLQKIFLYFKLEQQVLSGKNFSVTFHRLRELMGPRLDHPQFDILKNNMHGFSSSASLESSFRSYKVLSEESPKNFWDMMGSFFGNFLKVRNFRDKEKMDSLFTLIRNDQNKQALHFIEVHFPEYKEWSRNLKNKIEAKKALEELDNLLLASLRIKE